MVGDSWILDRRTDGLRRGVDGGDGCRLVCWKNCQRLR